MKLTSLLLVIAGFALNANASPTIDSLNVNGYMKKANGQAVTDGTYTIAYGVFQNGTLIWGKSYSTAIASGLFSKTISGVGGDLSALPAGTGMNTDFSATGTNVTLNAALLTAGGSGGITIRVYAVSAIDSTNPQFDISLAAVPTAMMAESAKGVVAGSVTTTGIATASKTNTSAGAGDAGKLVLLDASGLVATNMIPSLPASQITSGQIGVANGGTGSSDGSITGTGAIVYQSAAGSSTTIGDNSGAASAVIRSGTGGITGTVTGTTGNVAFTAGTTSGAVNLTAGTTSGDVNLTSGSAGVVNIASGTGLKLTNGTGAVTINAPSNPTSYTLTFPGTSGTANYFLQTNGSGTTTWAQAALPGANTDITGLAPTGALTVAPTTTLTLGNASSTGITVNPAGAVSIAPTTGDLTLSPASGNVIMSPTGNVTSAPSGTLTLNPTGAMTLQGASIGVSSALTVATGVSTAAAATTATMANGSNNNFAIGAGTFFRVSGPTAGFILTGLTGGADGRTVTLENTVAFPMLISIGSASSTAANRFGGTPCILTQYGTASFTYDATASLWMVTACNIGSGKVRAYTAPAANTTYGAGVGSAFLTNGADVVVVTSGGNFTITIQCITIDSTTQITPYTGQRLTVIFNPGNAAGAAQNMTISNNTACTTAKTVLTDTAAAVGGTAGANSVSVDLIYDGTRWVLINNVL